MSRDYARTSFWLETSEDDLTPRAPLSGNTEADVAILGAGFSGLWTAYDLQERAPSLRIVLGEVSLSGSAGISMGAEHTPRRVRNASRTRRRKASARPHSCGAYSRFSAFKDASSPK